MKLVALVLVAGLAGFLLLRSGERGSFDFQAFYCAGEALRMHANPYRAQPLGKCEHRQTDGTYAALPASVVLPAPQPGYDIGLFAGLSVLPFGVAKAVWGALLAMAIALAVYALFRVTGLPLATVVMAFAASLVLPALAFGELVAFFAAAACLAMLFAQRGQWSAAGIAAAAALVEPHLGLPVCIGLFVWQSRARVPIAITAAVLAAVSIAMLGVRENLEYVVTVLPLHALSEITSDAQLSLSAVLHGLHVSDAVALRAGTASYVALGAAGIFFGKTLANRFDDDAFVVAVPAAFAVIGGTFIHVTEVFAAVPLVLLLLARAPEERMPLLCAAVLLCVPWIGGIERGNAAAFALLGAIVVAVLLWKPQGGRIAVSLGAAAVALVVLLAAPGWYAHGVAAPQSPVGAIDPAYAQASWQRWNQAALSSGAAAAWTLRGATWLGLIVLATVASTLSRRPAASFAVPAQSTPSVR